MKREFCLSVSKALFESHRKDERKKTEAALHTKIKYVAFLAFSAGCYLSPSGER
jgi:hypothetical protein